MTMYYISSYDSPVVGQSFVLVPQPCTTFVKNQHQKIKHQKTQKGFVKQTVVTTKYPIKILPAYNFVIRLKFKKQKTYDGSYVGSDIIKQQNLIDAQRRKLRTCERSFARAIKTRQAYIY